MKRLFLIVVVATCVSGVDYVTTVADDRTVSVVSTPPSDFVRHYAELSLKLAEMDLKRATDLNKQVPNTFSPAALEPMQVAVNLAKQRLDQLTEKVNDPLYALYLYAEEAQMKAAELDYRKAVAANEHFPGTMDKDDIEYLRIAAEMAAMRYKHAVQTAGDPEMTRMRWQVEQLREEVTRLRATVDLLRKLD
jgi:hypothetical protein